MDPDLLSERGWKDLAQKFKLKDNGLQRALSVYEKLPQEKHAERLKTIGSVCALAGNLKRAPDVAAIPRAANYLADVVSAAESDRKQIQAAAAKANAEAKKREAQDQQDVDKEESHYLAQLMVAFQKLKSTKDLSYEFIVCDAKPHCGVMVAKRITSQHKEELSRVTGGSKRFLHLGMCHFEDGHLVFSMEQPVTGLARKLQDSIKHFTGKKLPIVVGAESADDEK